jgi:hypothetical protein
MKKINEEEKWSERELEVYWDEELLAEDWLSEEDNLAWKDL